MITFGTMNRVRVIYETKTGLASSPTTFSFKIPEKRVNLLNVKVNCSLSESAFKNYGIYATKGGQSRIIGGGKLTPLTLSTPEGTGGGGASGGSGNGGGGSNPIIAAPLSILENEDLEVKVNHGGASGSEETITVTVEYVVLEP